MRYSERMTKKPWPRLLKADFIFFDALFTALFLYLWFVIDPRFHFHAQEPVFFLNSHFIRDSNAVPGGWIEAVAALMLHLFSQPWIGALLLTVTVALICVLTAAVVRKGSGRSIAILPLIPAVLALPLLSDYQFSPAFFLGLVTALAFVRLYMALSGVLRLVSFVVLAVFTHIIGAGFTLPFALLTALHELLQRRPWVAAAEILFAAVLPWLSASFFYLVTLKHAYLHLLFPSHVTITLLMLLFAPLAILIGRLIPGRVKLPDIRYSQWIGGIALLLAAAAAAWIIRPGPERIPLRIDYLARYGEWNDVLETAGQWPAKHAFKSYYVNRALAHLGRLSDEMFAWPQQAAGDGLLMADPENPAPPLLRSDIYFDLGLINEAHHWAHEALSIKGPTSYILQRLVLTNLLKNEINAADKFLAVLAGNPIFKGWAERYRPLLEGRGTFEKVDPELARLSALNLERDFILNPNLPYQFLDSLITHNSANRMAYDYLMAHYLIKGELDRFVVNLGRLNKMGYRALPRHFEEALLIFMIQSKKQSFKLPKNAMNPETLRRFQRFQQIMTQYRDNHDAGLRVLKKEFADTYWYYALIHFHLQG